MSNAILTPITLWKNSDAVLPLEKVSTERFVCDGIVWENVRFSGRETGYGRVSVSGVYAHRENESCEAALLFLPEVGKKEDKVLIERFVKMGFSVLSVDYCGAGSAVGTRYPTALSYANFDQADYSCNLEEDAAETCYYEWGCTARYAVKFLKESCPQKKVGVFGTGYGGDVAWYLASMDEEIDCVAVAHSVGWRAYAKAFRYGENPEPAFEEGNYRYLAGIDIQAYAQYVKCPVLIMASTNDPHCDCDRAGDTIARLDGNLQSSLYLSVNSEYYLDNRALKDLALFFNSLVQECPLHRVAEIVAESEEKSLLVKVLPEQGEKITRIVLYGAFNEVNPALRCWEPIAVIEPNEGEYKYSFLPKTGENNIFLFAEIEYDDGFLLSTKVIAKNFSESRNYTNRLLYNNKRSCDLFIPLFQTGVMYGDTFLSQSGNAVCVKNGPMEIAGAYGEGGLKTYKINEIKRYLTEDSLLLMDLYSPEKSLLSVEVVCDADTSAETHYFAEAKVPGGETWHSLKFYLNKFKTEDGMLLKTPDRINLLVLRVDGDFLVNNVLWL